MRRACAALLAVAALCATAGCGSQPDAAAGPPPGLAEIDRVVQSALTALADARVGRFCALLTESGEQATIGDHGTCEEGARVLSRNVGARVRQQWRDLRVVDLDGDVIA